MHRNPVGVLGGRCAFLKTVTVKLAEKISLSSSATFSLVVWDGMSDAAVWDSGAGSALSQKEVTVGLYPGQVKVLCYLSDAALAKLNFAGCKRAPRISPTQAPPPPQGGKREPGCRGVGGRRAVLVGLLLWTALWTVALRAASPQSCGAE